VRKTFGARSPSYVRGVSDRLGRVLQKFRIRKAFKPVRTPGHIFRKSKDRPPADRIGGIVYKGKCNDCSFTYIGESERSWTSRGAQHEPGCASNKGSAIKQHDETRDHDIHPRDAKSSSAAYLTTEKGFSWNRDTPPWTVTLGTRGKRSLALICR